MTHNSLGQFTTGNIPWNKGRTGIHLSPATEFKKGTLRGQAARNWKSLGTITVRRHKGVKSRWIKVTNKGRAQDNYIPLARWGWARDHGPIPPGCCVVHRDGNTMNDHPHNWALLDRKSLFAWEKSVRPQFELKRRRTARESARIRWEIYRDKAARRRDRERAA